MAIPHVNRKLFPNPLGGDKTHLLCDYFGRNCHTQKTCFNLHGRSNNGKAGKFADQPMSTTNEVAWYPFTKEQMDHLLILLKFSSSHNIHVGTVAQTCKNSWALFVQHHSNPWIIDPVLVSLVLGLKKLGYLRVIIPVLETHAI